MRLAHGGVLALWIVAVQHLAHIEVKETGKGTIARAQRIRSQTVVCRMKDRILKMAYATSNTQFGQSSLTERFAKVISGAFKVIPAVLKAVATATVQARFVQELNAMSDRELADIGINRVDIPTIAKEATRM
jgi:uncharacterized protein YjiS (DUF1127 family)